MTTRPTEHVCEVQSRSCTVAELLPSQAAPGPQQRRVLVKTKGAPPHPQEPEDRCHFRLHNTFSETCFSFLSRCCNKPLQEHWAGFPGGACLGMGQGGGRPRSLRVCTSWNPERTQEVVLSCANVFTQCAHCWAWAAGFITPPFSPTHPRLPQQTQSGLV